MVTTLDPGTLVGDRLDLGGLDLFTAFTEWPLDVDTLRCLQYMHDVENHTVCYMRDALVTDAHRDPRLTTFLTMWNYEEHWHGEALGTVLAAHGRPSGPGRVAQVRRQLGWKDRWRPLTFLIGSLAFRDMVAVQMTWGAVNELTTQAAYGQLARRSGHPVLTELLRRIMRQEGRHVAFYASESRSRLAGSGAARRLVRLALRRYWAPVGHGVRPDSEAGFLIRHLFGDETGRAAAARIDGHVDRLPGLAGLRLVSGAVDRYCGGVSNGPMMRRRERRAASVSSRSTTEAGMRRKDAPMRTNISATSSASASWSSPSSAPVTTW
jgi:hypothetical protein